MPGTGDERRTWYLDDVCSLEELNLSCSKEYFKLNIMGILELNLAAVYFRI